MSFAEFRTFVLSGTQTDLPCATHQCEATAGSPINLANGNTWIERSDFSIPGLGGGLSLTRSWNSIWTNPNDPTVEQVGLFGDSWRSNFEERLQPITGGGLRYWRGNGSSWIFSYDSVNQVYTLTSPPDEHASLVAAGGGQFTLAFKDGRKRLFTNGYLTAVQDRNGNQTTLQWDTTTAGKLLRVTDASGRYVTFTYGDANNPHCVTAVQYALPGTDPVQFVTLASYAYYPDTAARIKTITYPDTTTVNFDYTDPNSNTLITRVYDGAGKDFENHTYDIYRRGLNLRARDTNLAYDNFGSLTQVTFPGSPAPKETFVYDAVGNVSQVLDRINQSGGQLFRYTYDNMYRLIQKDTPDSNTIRYSYDAASRLTQAQDNTGSYAFSYDNMNRLTQATSTYQGLSARSVSYTYDSASNRKTMSSPDLPGNSTYTYDVLNRLQNILDFNNNSFDFGYDDINRPTSLTRRTNGVNTTATYKPNTNLLQSILHQLGSTVLDGASYTYDNVGNRLTKGNGVYAINDYSYDNTYQLTDVDIPPPPGCPDCPIQLVEHYSYDAVGNRLTDFSGASYVYNNPWNHLDSKGAISYSYDANGNTKTNGTTTYNWNSENRLTSVVLPGSGGTVTFKYDPFGRRIQKSSLAGTINYLYDGSDVIEEIDGSGSQLARYSQGLGVDQPLSLTRGGVTSFYEADGLGSITSLTNTSGGVTDTYTYDSYGNLTASSGTTTNPYRYTGREYDPETGLYYYRARYYDSTVGRFLNEDPLEFAAGVNYYRYVHNRPSVITDPSGLLDVYLWYPKGEMFGHSSIRLNNGTYIGWWPDASPRTPKKGECNCVKDNLYSAPAIPDRQFSDDVQGEQRQPDEIIHIDGLDEDAIQAWWNNFKSSHDWETRKQNCSTTVYDALHAGGGFPTAVPLWSPAIVAQYAVEVKIQLQIMRVITTTFNGPI